MFDEKFWLAIAFLGFLALILKYVMPSLTKGLDEKSKLIAKELEEAKALKEKARALLEDAQKRYQESVVFSEKLIKDSAIEAQKFLKDAHDAANAETAKKMTALNNRIKQEEENAVREIKTKIITLAIASLQSNISNVKKDSLDNSLKNSLNDISKLIH